ncbi:amidase [Corynebacterium sp. NML130628]|uniref:amidase family protein n=1 Tax=Corynebacterium sp. NML130628 TaxID=1906333 RepID=UPI0009F97E97|nr:amidase [Corynebacterium sp. NML130628]
MLYSPASAALVYSPPTPLRTGQGRLSSWQIPIKDGTDVAGMPTSHGNPARKVVAEKHSPIVAALLESGASIPGKSLTAELGATCYAEEAHSPTLQSPIFPGCTPGGSSAGAGVLVGSGLYRAAHGTDAGGSLRVPAAACGVVGYKPGTHAPVAQGFITRSVIDQFELYGHHPTPVRKLRIGVLIDGLFANTTVSSGRGDALDAAAHELGKHHEVVLLRPYADAQVTFEHFKHRITHSFCKVEPLENPYLAWMREQGRTVSPAALHNAHEHFRHLLGHVQHEWDVDIVLTPTIAFDPPSIGYFSSLTPEESFYRQTVWTPWCTLFNVMGSPAVAVGALHLGSVTVGGRALLSVARTVERFGLPDAL